MRVALVFNGLGIGGVERIGINYSKIFLKLGYEVDIYNLQPEYNELEASFPEECRIMHKKMPIWVLPDYFMLLVKRWKWGKFAYPVVYAGTSLLSAFNKIGVDRSVKYDIAVAFAGHIRDLTFVTKNYIKSEKKMCWLHGSLSDYLLATCTYGDLYRKIKNLCVLSEFNQVMALRTHRYLEELKINQIYNPIPDKKEEIDENLVKELKEKYGEFLLMVGRFADDKDQKTVIRAMSILKSKYGISNKILFVGGGDTMDECKALAEDLNISDQVVFIGPRYDVQNFYTAAHMFIHSSPTEGLPTVLLEAMKYGVPIVATDSLPGVTEILKQDKYGLRCEVGNSEDMAEKIYKMISDSTLRNSYVEMGNERIRDFSYDSITERLSTIVDNLE